VDGRPGGGRVPGGASIPLSPCCDAPMLQSGRKAICTVCRGEIRRCK
jgi:hypothetical protein